jgi:hypothetical protein
MADYMRFGFPIVEAIATVTDLIDENKEISSGTSLMSDGAWLWRTDSIHYLAIHPLNIPDEFLDHVRAQGYRPFDVDISDETIEAAIDRYS